MNETKLDVDAFWTRLKELAKEKGLTIEQVSLEIGTLPQNMVNKKYRKTFPTLEELVRISSTLDTSVDYLLLGKFDNPAKRQVDELKEHLRQANDIASRL